MSELFNQEPETAVLSILIRNPDSYFQLGNLKSSILSSEPYKEVLKAIEELRDRDIVPSLPILRNFLESAGKLHLAGGGELLNYLGNLQYPVEDIKAYANLVMESYRARVLINMASKIPEMVSSGNMDNAVADIRKLVDNISTVGGLEDTTSIAETLTDTFNKLQERVASGGVIPGITTGISAMDMATGGFCKGDVWVIAGRPSMGKSAWECNSMLKVAKAGHAVLTFSLEMPKNSLVERLLSIETGIDGTKIRFGTLKQDELDTIFDAAKRLKTLPIFIDSNFSSSLGYITSVIRKYKKTNDVSVVYLDYIQLLAERSLDATNELGRITRGLKLLANDLGISIVLLCQLNRGVESRDDKRPNLSDLRQSGNIEEDADVVVMLYRDEYYDKESKRKGEIENIIRKQRNGPIGTLCTKFIPNNGRITEE